MEMFQRDGELVLRPKSRTAGEVFADLRRGCDWKSIQRPEQGDVQPVAAWQGSGGDGQRPSSRPADPDSTS